MAISFAHPRTATHTASEFIRCDDECNGLDSEPATAVVDTAAPESVSLADALDAVARCRAMYPAEMVGEKTAIRLGIALDQVAQRLSERAVHAGAASRVPRVPNPSATRSAPSAQQSPAPAPASQPTATDAFELPVEAYRQKTPPAHIEPLAVRESPPPSSAVPSLVGRRVSSSALAGTGEPAMEREEPKLSTSAATTVEATAPGPRGPSLELADARQRWVFEPEPPDDAPEPDDPVRSALREAAIAAVLRMRAAAPHSGGVSIVLDASTEPLPCPDSAASKSATPHHTGGVSSSKNAPVDRWHSSDGGIRSPARPGAPAWVSHPGTPTGAALQNMSRVSATPPTV